MQTKYHKDMFFRIQESPKPLGTILYIHGLGDSGMSFERLVQNPKLSEWTHIIPDLRGYGKSLWPAGGLPSLSDHASSIQSFIQDTNLENQRIFLVGHSMGAVIATLLLESAPELFSGFVNIEGNISIEDCLYSSKATVYSADEFEARGFEQLKASLFDISFSEPATRQYYISLCLSSPLVFYENAEELIALSTEEQLAPRMEAIKLPKIFICGKPNGICDRSRMLLTASGVKTASVLNGGHWPFLENEALFITIFRKFILAQNTVVANC